MTTEIISTTSECEIVSSRIVNALRETIFFKMLFNSACEYSKVKVFAVEC